MLFALDPLPPANLLAARDQMAVTLGFHIILACLGVALPDAPPDRQLAGHPARRRRRAAPGPALVADHRRDLRRRGGLGHDPVVRDGPPVAGPDGPLRRAPTASRSRSRGSSSSSRRSSSPSTSTAGIASRRGSTSLSGIPIAIAGFGGTFSVVDGQRLDEPAGRLHPRRGRPGDRRPAARGHLQQRDLVRGRPHVPGGLHGHRASCWPRPTPSAGCAAGWTATPGSGS